MWLPSREGATSMQRGTIASLNRLKESERLALIGTALEEGLDRPAGRAYMEDWHDRYQRTTETLFRQERAQTDERLRIALNQAPEEHKPLVSYINAHIFDADLSVEVARVATGIQASGLNQALGNVKSFSAYVGKARIETAERMAKAGLVPLGCIMRAVGISSYWTFMRHWKAYARNELKVFNSAERLETSFDVASWYHLVNGSLGDRAEILAEFLHAACPAAFDHLPFPKDVQTDIEASAMRFHLPEEILSDLGVAARRPLRAVAWAISAAGVEYGGLFSYLSKQLFNPNRESLHPLMLKAAKAAIPMKDSSPGSRIVFLIGEKWRTFIEKRLAEAALGLLPSYSVPAIASVLGLAESKLDKIVSQRTGVSVFRLARILGNSAGHPIFETWISAGTRPEGIHLDEARQLIGLLGQTTGGCSKLVRTLAVRKTLEPQTVKTTLIGAEAVDGAGKDWTVLGALAEALDYTAEDSSSHKRILDELLGGTLREEVIELSWLRSRLILSGHSKSYRQTFEDWKYVSSNVNLGERYSQTAAWVYIRQYKNSPATPMRSRWIDMAESALEGLQNPLHGLLKAYRAADIIFFKSDSLDLAFTHIADSESLIPADADPWIVTEHMFYKALALTKSGKEEGALEVLHRSLELARRENLVEQAAVAVIEIAFTLTLYGVAMSREFSDLLQGSRWISGRILRILRIRALQDAIYFSKDLDEIVLQRELRDLYEECQGDPVHAAWVKTMEGLLLLRFSSFREAFERLSNARECFISYNQPDKENWVDIFLAIALFAEGDTRKASSHAEKAAKFFAQESYGRVRECALRCLGSPTEGYVADLARTTVCPRAAIGSLAQGPTWGAVTLVS